MSDGVPADYLRKEKDVEQTRSARAAAQQRAEQAAQQQATLQ